MIRLMQIEGKPGFEQNTTSFLDLRGEAEKRFAYRTRQSSAIKISRRSAAMRSACLRVQR
jgi:hypothetical protein